MSKNKKPRFNFPPDDKVTCPVCGKECVAFINISYYHAYTVRCYKCDKEYDYATKQHFLDNPDVDLHGNKVKEKL